MKLGRSGMCDRFGTDMSYSLSIPVFLYSSTHFSALRIHIFCSIRHQKEAKR